MSAFLQQHSQRRLAGCCLVIHVAASPPAAAIRPRSRLLPVDDTDEERELLKERGDEAGEDEGVTVDAPGTFFGRPRPLPPEPEELEDDGTGERDAALGDLREPPSLGPAPIGAGIFSPLQHAAPAKPVLSH